MVASTSFTFCFFSGCDARKRMCLFNHVRKQVNTNTEVLHGSMLHGRNNSLFFSIGKKISFLCKIFSLSLPCSTAAVQNLYTVVLCSRIHVYGVNIGLFLANQPGGVVTNFL